MDNERIYLEIVNSMREGVYLTSQDRTILFWNKAAESITGYRKEEIVGKHCQNTPLEHIDSEGRTICMTGCPLHATLLDGQQRSRNIFLKHLKGHRLAVKAQFFPIREDGRIVGAIEIFTPESTTEYNNDLIENLSNSAMNDQLTGLPNRRKVESFLDFRLKERELFLHDFFVVFLDIDHFRYFNNTYGHDAGDVVLKSIADAVKQVIRTNDLFGRWGGEEFIGVFMIKNEKDALLLAEKIRVLIENIDIVIHGKALKVTASLGITKALEGDTIDSVVKRADELMYQSKKNGRNKVSADVHILS